MRSRLAGNKCAVVLLLTLGSGASWACSYSSFPRSVTSSFSVEVMHRGKPIRGLGIALKTVFDSESNAEPAVVASGVTDEQGRFAFTDVKPGKYDVEVVQPALPYSILVEVGSRDKRSKPVKVLHFEWPGDAITVREAVGTIRVVRKTGNRLMDLARPQFQFAPGAKVILADLISNKAVAATLADDNGKFSFEKASPGLYVLHIERPADDSFPAVVSDTPLHIDPSAAELIMDLHLREICGTMVASNGYPR